MNRFQPTQPRVRYHILLYAILAAVLALAGCGGDDDSGSGSSDYKLRTTAFKSNAVREPGESGTMKVNSCRALSRAFVARTVKARSLKPSPNNSLDLSICDWDAGGRHVKLFVDTAPKAQLRYYNLLSEQHEYYNADPELKARQIKGVGEDSAYGGAGAWWTRGRNQLVAYDHDKIVKVRVNVRGWSDARARAAAIRIGKRAVRKLRGTHS
jgi:hypothetical protein